MTWKWNVHLSCGCVWWLKGREEYDSLSVLDEYICEDHGTQTIVRIGGHN